MELISDRRSYERARVRVPTGFRCLLNFMLILNAYPEPNSASLALGVRLSIEKCLLSTKELAEALRDAVIHPGGAFAHRNRGVEHLSSDRAHLSHGGSASATAE